MTQQVGSLLQIWFQLVELGRGRLDELCVALSRWAWIRGSRNDPVS